MRASRTTATAAVMNDLFVNIKVDREERPDVDAIYMAALHQLGEQGGWPLTMFLTPDGEPFWGGTYFPPEDRYGRPAFVSVLNTVARVYRDEPDKVRNNAEALKQALKPKPPQGRRRGASTTRPCPTSRGASSAPSIRRKAACAAHRNFRRRNSSNFCGARACATASTNPRERGEPHAHPYRARRHLRSSRRRLLALQRRRALARAAFRKDALRQRAARRPDDRGPGARESRRSSRNASPRPSTGSTREMVTRRRRVRRVARRRQRRRRRQVLCVDVSPRSTMFSVRTMQTFRARSTT